jgi:hypothetical protein
MQRALQVLATAAFALVGSSCTPLGTNPGSGYLAGYDRPQQARPYHGPRDDVSYWDGDGVTGSPTVVINLHLQKASFYKGDQLVGVSKISTGREGHDTPPGRYKIIQKNKDHRSNLYGVFKDEVTHQVVDDDADLTSEKAPPGTYFEGASMPYFMRFNGGIGMHTGYLPGYNASHGCVRMPDHMARKFFENVRIGTPVIVE